MKYYPTALLILLLFFSHGLWGQTAPSIRTMLQDHLRHLDSGRSVMIHQEVLPGNQILGKVYLETGYTLIWTHSQNRRDLITILQDSFYEGLYPDDYHLPVLLEYESERRKNGNLLLKDLVESDLLMTNAALTFAHHMIQGKLHPTMLDPNWNYAMRPLPDHMEFRLLYRINTKTLPEAAQLIRPELPIYNQFRKWFRHFDSLSKANVTVPQISFPGKALKKGDVSPNVLELKRHLANYGYSFQAAESDTFGIDLEENIKAYQQNHGMEADGVAGKRTYETLNLTNQDRLDILRVNMERCRWIDNEIPDHYLLVNIADFHLYIIKNGKTDYQSRVVVGKENHETPIFGSQIEYIVFNPTWSVPASISIGEILPHLKTDPGYLKRNNMVLTNGSQEVDPEQIDFSGYSLNYFPYTITQTPGQHNALGSMKFIFPNKHSVYLHDTPSKSYFERSERAFSHGCIRVQNPQNLASQLLSTQGYSLEKIKEIVASKETSTVYLQPALPIFILYWTCYEYDNNGKIYFFRDIYGRDQRILQQLKSKI